MGKMAKVGGGGESATPNYGGILGSGIFGMFGTTVQCKAEDQSMYCNVMKLFNILIVLFVVAVILYYVSLFLFPRGLNRGGKRGR